jgi:tetratricopeptide (TPR) repeat protein
MISYYRLNDDSINESNIFKEFSDIFNDNPSILNQYAWRMTELGKNLNDALNKSNQAIALSDNNLSLQAYIIDTKAEILWMLGRVDEAIIAIDLAIDINPDDEYLIEQRYKFLNSKNKGSINDN